jgi:acetolactate synthase regulatory subunit
MPEEFKKKFKVNHDLYFGRVSDSSPYTSAVSTSSNAVKVLTVDEDREMKLIEEGLKNFSSMRASKTAKSTSSNSATALTVDKDREMKLIEEKLKKFSSMKASKTAAMIASKAKIEKEKASQIKKNPKVTDTLLKVWILNRYKHFLSFIK